MSINISSVSWESKEMPEVKLADVIQAYRGKPNRCMCGCAGTYFFTKKGAVTAKRQDWQGDIDEATVQRIINMMTRKAGFPTELILSGDRIILTKVIGQTQYTLYCNR